MADTIKDINTNRNLQPNEWAHAWQNYVLCRSEVGGEDNLLNCIDNVLGNVDQKVVEEIKELAVEEEYKIKIANYNQGFLDGIRLALVLGK